MTVITGICLEGGGVLGTAYAGCCRALENRGVLQNLNKFAGTSVGAITAGLLACRANADFVEKALNEMNYKLMEDNDIGFINDLRRLYNYYGWNKGHYFYNWYAKQLYDLTGDSNITFLEANMKYKTVLKVVGSNITQSRIDVFDYINTPNLAILDAVRISMSVPIMFSSIKYKNNHYVDGAVGLNYPISVFERRGDIIGIKLDPQNEINGNYSSRLKNFIVGRIIYPIVYYKDKLFNQPPTRPVTNIIDFMTRILIFNYNNPEIISPEDLQRTCVVNCGKISAINFDITENDRRYLYKQGFKYTNRFLDSYEF